MSRDMQRYEDLMEIGARKIIRRTKVRVLWAKVKLFFNRNLENYLNVARLEADLRMYKKMSRYCKD